jgi:hypothetical protein
VISKQLVRLLITGQDGFLDEARDVLRAGLASAAWTAGAPPGCERLLHPMGNTHFAWFGTTHSKSRGKFLELLRAGFGDYVLNAESLAYMRQRSLAGPVIAA